MAITERDAQRAIDRALRDVRSTAFSQATKRRAVLLDAFENAVRDFIDDARRVTRRNQPLSRAERDAMYALMLIALARIRAAYTSAGEDALSLTSYIVTRLQTAHANIVFQASGVTQRNAANDAFTQLLRNVEEIVRDDVRRQRRNAMSVETIVETAVEAAMESVREILDAAEEDELDADSVASDLGLLLLGNDIEYNDYSMQRKEMTPVRMLLFSATMLTLSETFNVMRAAESESLERLNLVETGRWTLSSKHSTLASSPDACDDLARQNVGYGAGRYPVIGWPQAPHPHCACYMSDPKFQNFRAWLSQWV